MSMEIIRNCWTDHSPAARAQDASKSLMDVVRENGARITDDIDALDDVASAKADGTRLVVSLLGRDKLEAVKQRVEGVLKSAGFGDLQVEFESQAQKPVAQKQQSSSYWDNLTEALYTDPVTGQTRSH